MGVMAADSKTTKTNMNFLKRWFSFLLLTVFCLIINIPLPSQLSSVYNEYGRLASGQINIISGDFSPFHVNPPLPNIIGALPCVLLNAEYVTPADLGYSHFGRSEYKANHVFVKKNPNHRKLLVFGRIALIVFPVIGLFFCYIWSYSQSGYCSAIIAGMLWIFSPFVIGHGTLISPDVPSAALGVASVYFFWKWLKHPAMLEAFSAGIILGLAELTKFTLLIFYPLFIVLWFLYRKPDFKQVKQISVIFVTSFLVINMGYLFEGTGKLLGSYRFQTTLFTGCQTLTDVPSSGGNRFEKTPFAYIPIPLPSNFVQGIDTQRLDFERGLPSYLRGEWSDHGWWYYYLYALLLKTPLGTIGLFLLTIFCTFFQKCYNISWRDEIVIILPGIVLLAFVSSQTGFSIHSRYVIPALPFFFIWIAKVGKAFTMQRQIVVTLISILLTWSIFSSLWIYPHSISYFNELAAILPTPEDKNYPKPGKTSPKTFWQKTKRLFDCGSRNGARHLLDSNIDWRQDLFYLEKWYQKHPEAQNINIACWGNYPLELITISSKEMPPANEPQPGWYALSVNYIYNCEKQYQYFLNFEPVTMMGYSIYIYHITQDDIDKLRSEKNLR
jgi:4-amino-4-deoxy-L-arabinose transferase-like glycosyltransferase